MFKAFAIAFAMYSRIPVPYFKWDDKSARYAICFFPFVGIAVGITEYIVFYLFSSFEANFLRICLMSTVPLIIRGGIHMDGFMDTADALSSHADMEKKLQILKDPHTGAFAVIAFGIYMILTAGFVSVIKMETLMIFCLGFILSRALSSIYVLTFDKARNTGLAAQWSEFTNIKKALIVLIFETAVCVALMLFFNMTAGFLTVVFTVAVSIYHYYNCKKNFGGITGDLAGYFLQIEELAVLIACAVGGNI